MKKERFEIEVAPCLSTLSSGHGAEGQPQSIIALDLLFLGALPPAPPTVARACDLWFRYSGMENGENYKLEAIDYDQIGCLVSGQYGNHYREFGNLKGIYRSTLISFLQESRLRETSLDYQWCFVERVINRIKPNNIDEMLRGYYLERKIDFRI